MADALSRLGMDLDSNEDSNDCIPKDGTAQLTASCMCMLLCDESYKIPSAKDPACMADCFLKNVVKEKELSLFPMDPKVLYKKNLMHKMKTSAKGYGTTLLEGQVLITKDDKIVVPSLELQEDIVA